MVTEHLPAGSGAFDLELAEMLFALSRRTQQALSVVSLEITQNRTPGRTSLGRVEREIAAAVRRTDLLVRWASDDEVSHYALFCPFTDAQGAKELIRRISRAVAPSAIRGGAATFPYDALSLDELIDAALFDANGSREISAPLQNGASELIRKPRVSRLDGTPDRRTAARVKRAFDLLFTLVTAPVWLPAIALVALAIKLSAPRAPVMFPQLRTGRGGRRFWMYKFRTMVPDAEEQKKKYAHLNELAWPDFKIENDPRVTRIGRFLRKSSLDEVPQILNVLRGDMSWVGPRPTSFGPETYEVWQTARLDVVPGITGLWQVTGRGCTEFDVRLRLDMDYIDRRSLWLDLKILLLTVGEVFRPRGRA